MTGMRYLHNGMNFLEYWSTGMLGFVIFSLLHHSMVPSFSGNANIDGFVKSRIFRFFWIPAAVYPVIRTTFYDSVKIGILQDSCTKESWPIENPAMRGRARFGY